MKLNSANGRKISRLAVIVVAGLLPLSAKGLPDLVINVQRAQATIEYQRQYFTPGQCAVSEGCVRTMGGRKLLRLDVGVMNVGQSDLVIGDPNRRRDLFTWSGCHG